MSVQISSRPVPGQGGGAIGVRAPFAAMPHALIGDKRLKAGDVRLAGIIMRYARAKATAWPSVKTLAADLGRCERTVQYALRRLADAGWITQRPDPNPTGRVLVLAWREVAQTPKPLPPYSQGLPRCKVIAPPRCNDREAATATGGAMALHPNAEGRKGEGSALANGERKTPERPMTHAELLAWYGDVGWLKLPPSDPLRRIADRALDRALKPSVGPIGGGGRSAGTIALSKVLGGSTG